ncbi:glycoprotein endo-alpha-1,2-mannosidase-like [Diadema antillarum]|uniref:glycoprotein endo-alpha-1,2-mannosidase-like n=1 Tax=Diadema antillarum TaxID=105358 RepID=UPI003A8C61F2
MDIMTVCRPGRRSWRFLGMAIVVTFLAGCFVAISNLMSVDSFQEAEAAQNILKQLKKNSILQKGKGAGVANQQEYSARETQGEQGDRKRNSSKTISKLRDDIPVRQNISSKSKFPQPFKDGAHRENENNPNLGPGGEPPDTNAEEDASSWPRPNYNLHTFYYPWYGNPEFDSTYLHWNHELLPHWNKQEAKKWPRGRWKPPGEIGANFYPQLGCYSSRDPAIIEDHMKQLRLAGIGVLSISWYPAGLADDQGKPSDDLIPTYLDTAHKHGLKVAFHSEPYKGRTAKSFLQDVRYIVDSYGAHPAFYRYNRRGRSLPVFYVYDSYLTNASSWAQVFSSDGPLTVRNSKYDGLFLGLYVEAKHKNDIIKGSFDGFYTYFASNGFTYASRWQNWKLLAEFANKRGLLFLPSVGPGYVDTRVRPWNGMNTRQRDGGNYYDRAFRAALEVKPSIITITSFNEWHEGTQIERAVPKKFNNLTYLDYGSQGPNKYLLLTQKWSKTLPGG